MEVSMLIDSGKLILPITEAAKKHNINSAIVYGIIKAESGYNGKFELTAARYEPTYQWLYKPQEVKPAICSLATETCLQRTSIGLMQVMGAVYREYGYRGWLTDLFKNIKLQLDYGCKHLAGKIKRYGELRGISAYNAGSPTSSNAGYVAKVVAYSKEWQSLRLAEPEAANG